LKKQTLQNGKTGVFADNEILMPFCRVPDFFSTAFLVVYN